LRRLIFTFGFLFLNSFLVYSIDQKEALHYSELLDSLTDNNLILSKEYLKDNPTKAISFITQTIETSDNELLIAKCYLQAAIIYNYSFLHKGKSALENLSNAKEIYLRTKNQEKLIFTDILIGQVYVKTGDLLVAKNIFNKAFKKSQEFKAFPLAFLAQLALIDIDNSLLVFNDDELIKLIDKFDNSKQKAHAFFISFKRAALNNWENLAVEYLDSAETLYNKSSLHNLSIDMLIKKAELYESKDNVQKVVQLNENIYQKSIAYNYGKGLIYSCYKLADFFESIERYDFANPYLKYINKIEMAEGEKELNQKILLAEKEKKIDLERVSAKNEVKYQGYLTMLGFGVALLILILAIYIFSAYKTKSTLANDLLLAYNNNEELKKEKDDFLAYTTHEIRTPLSAVISASEILDRTKLNSAQKEHLTALKSSASNILFLVNDILDLAKLEKRKIVLEKTPFSPVQIIQNTISILNSKAIGNNVEVDFICEENFPKNILGDSFRFQQIVVNLLDNAIKYAPNGKASIFLKVQNKNHLKVIVKDNGKGIDKDKLKIIFKAYAQEKINTSRQYGGTGLGLAICDLIIKLMEGNIQVNSNPKGTEFSFEIPMQIVKKLSIKDPKQYDLQVNNINILMAEDDELNGQLFKNLIQDSKNNIKVDWVKNGIEVMERITEKSYQIILMDIEMPLKNGFETSQLIRKHKDQKLIKIPIIAMTAHLVEDVLQKCYESGMNDCISKPFKLDFLYKKIHETLNLSVPNYNPIKENIEKYLKIYIKNFKADFSNLISFIEAGDVENIKSKLHKMKGSSATMEFKNIVATLAEMENKKRVDLKDDLLKLKRQFFNSTNENIEI